MEEVFKPSLIITLGTNAKEIALFTQKKLTSLTKPFTDLIYYYEILNIDSIQQEVQRIIDTKLLNGRYVNTLVDLGYKLRNENISEVKLNIYFIWDVYNCELSAFEVIKILKDLNYGNINKGQHSGASLYIIPIMEKQWTIDEEKVKESLEILCNITKYISEENTMIKIDSKIYILNSVSEDGVRISEDELIYIASTLLYINIIPSKYPPLSQYNYRLLMHEPKYKVGTVGITGINFSKEQLVQEFSRYAAVDLLKYAAQYQCALDFQDYNSFNLIEEYGDKRNWTANIILNEEEEIKEKVNRKLAINECKAKEAIDIDLNKVILEHSFKMAINYLNEIKKIVNENLYKDKIKILFKKQVENRSSKLNNFINKIKEKINLLINKYKLETNKPKLENNEEKENIVNQCLDQAIDEYFEMLLKYVEKKEEILLKSITSFNKCASNIEPKENMALIQSNLISELLNFEDIRKYYTEKKKDIYPIYFGLIKELKGYEEIEEEVFENKLIGYVEKAYKEEFSMNFNEFLRYKFQEDLSGELSKCINIGLVKSKYLFQYVTRDSLEEHGLFICPSQVYEEVKGVVDKKLKDFNVSISQGQDSNSIFLIRVCLGIDINKDYNDLLY